MFKFLTRDTLPEVDQEILLIEKSEDGNYIDLTTFKGVEEKQYAGKLTLIAYFDDGEFDFDLREKEWETQVWIGSKDFSKTVIDSMFMNQSDDYEN